MNVLIIEDEIKAAKELERILLEIETQISIVGIIDSVEDGIEYLSQNSQPDLIFSDIQLSDGVCFEIYKQVSVKSPIIFCTAFDEYLMDAFDTNAVSYILKPITIEKVEAAIAKFHQMKTAFEPVNLVSVIKRIASQLKYGFKTALLVSHKEKIIPIQVKDIAFFYLDKTIVKVSTINNQRYFLSSSLDDIEGVLDPDLFYRANRQYLINKNTITNAERYFSRKLVVKLNVDTPETIVVSKAKVTEFLRWLEGNAH